MRVRSLVPLAIVALVVSVAGGVEPAGATAADASSRDGVDWGALDTEGLTAVAAAPDPGTQMVFLLGLVGQGDPAGRARQVSDPRAASYGRYETLRTLVDQISATPGAAAAIGTYFSGEGLTATVDPTRTYAQVVMTLADAERIFATTWAGFEYPATSTWDGIVMLYPTERPQLPSALSGLVDRVHGAVAFSPALSSAVAAAALTGNGDGAADRHTTPLGHTVGDAGVEGAELAAGGSPFRTGVATGCEAALALTAQGRPFGLSPSQLLAAYGIDDLHAAGLRGGGVRMAVIENQRYEPANLETYRQCFGLADATATTDHEQGVLVPANDAATPEAVLDLAVLSFAAPALDALDVFMVGKDPAVGAADPMNLIGLLDMFTAPIDAALAGGPTPDVVSASYSMCEASPLTLQGRTAYVGIFDDVLALAAAAGVSYVVSTGDYGSSACQQFRVPWDGTFPGISVQYPASSPFVTAVGGTNIALDTDNQIASSGVWNDTEFLDPAQLAASPQLRTGGTGGRSRLVPRPWFQDRVDGSPFRSVPDISLFADQLPGYLLYTGGWTSIGGTSAAAPLFAGVVALLTERAARTGQPRPGLVAPLLYELGAEGSGSLLDITIGDNIIFPEPSYGLTCCDAAPGYDLASGWGSPLADVLQADLEPPAVQLSAAPPAAGSGAPPGSGAIVLTATVVARAGQAIRYDWDLDGDGSIDRTTTSGSTVLGTAIDRSVTPTVTVTTSLGRSASATTTVSDRTGAPAPPEATPKPLAFTG